MGTKSELERKAAMLTQQEAELSAKMEELKVLQNQIKEESDKLEAAKRLVSLGRDPNPAGTGTGTVSNTTVMRGTIGSIAEFSLDEDWQMWYERLEQYCVTNEVPAEKHVSLFLTLLGKDGYALLRNLCTPRTPSHMSIIELAKIMKDHLQPAPSVIAERYKFKECRQRAGEDIKGYVANLKKMSTFCEFGSNLENHLRDQFVWGVASEAIKKKLLGEKELTYHRAIELAVSLESAVRDAAKMGVTSATTTDAVNFVADRKVAAGKQASASGNSSRNCYCCGGSNHRASDCRFKSYKCNSCGKVGHLIKMCKNKGTQKSEKKNSMKVNKDKKFNTTNSHENQNFVEEVESLGKMFDDVFSLSEEVNSIRESNNAKPLNVQLLIEGVKMVFEVDTGSPITAISSRVYKESKNLSNLKLDETARVFKTYHEKKIFPLGTIKVKVSYRDINSVLELFVLPSNSNTPIIGREWLRNLNMIQEGGSKEGANVLTIYAISDCTMASLSKEFDSVFSGKLGTFKGGKLSLLLKPNAIPAFYKPRPVPLAMRKSLDKELERLTNEKIIEKIDSSDWATPIVPVLKSNGEIRVCGDYSITLNGQLVIVRFPIPRIVDLVNKLQGGVIFSKLDLAHAYQQFELDEASKNLTTISTHKGLFRFNRLSYGIASAPGLFQREMEKLLEDVPGTAVYFDDIFISGKSQTEHDSNLREVLTRFKENGLTVKLEKCQFSEEKIQFLGYELDSHGLHVSEGKVKAILKMEAPSNIHELKSFLGAMQYYAKFIKDFAKVVSPLYELLRKDVTWDWTAEREAAFQASKECLISRDVLTHYSTEVPIKVTCDASPKGIGAVLSHMFPDGSEKPVAYASRVLTRAERNYSQLDREALALVFGVKSFHQYIYGREFILETDHKPLAFIFGSKRGIPQMAASRVQRWAIFLTGYDFHIKHIKGENNGPADALSRVFS